MRTGARRVSPVACDMHDHLMWVFDDDADFARAAVAFLADGVARGERLVYGAARPVPALTAELDGLGGRDTLVAAGALDIVDVRGLACLADADRHDLFRDAVTRAVADGHTGLRVAVDTTGMSGPAFDCDRQARWERWSDHLIVDHPVTAICGLNRAVVGDAAVADMVALHPSANGDDSPAPFAVFAVPGGAAVSGEVDVTHCDELARALALEEPGPHAVVLDLSRVDFIDGRGLATIVAWAHRQADAGGVLVVDGASPFVRRLWELCEFDRHPAAPIAEARPG